MNKSKIAVIEGKWFKDSNISVRGLFDLISDIQFDSPNEYHYEMFNNGDALKEIIKRLAATNNIHNIYIAAHGSESGIVGSSGQSISTTTLANIIKSTNTQRGKLHSIYFGSCSFGNTKNLEKLLLNAEGDQIRWLAGYTKEIDFVKSTMLDAIFWNEYLQLRKSRSLGKIEMACCRVVEQAEGLIKELGFKVIAYDGRKSNPVCELI